MSAPPMRLLRAGLVTMALLALGRLAGLLREMGIATVFGVSASADLVVAALSLPDWLAGTLAAGAVTYVLVPHWARVGSGGDDALSARFVLSLRVLAWLLGASLVLAPHGWLSALVSATASSGLDAGNGTLVMQLSGVAVVLAFEAVVPQAKLLSRESWVALHASNLLLSFTVLLGLFAAWLLHGHHAVVLFVASVAIVAHAVRLIWLRRQVAGSTALLPSTVAALPVSWIAATLAVGVPYALPFVARSAGAQGGPGDVASFSYAWKLVELPLTLVLQWLGLLALPSLAKAQMAGDRRELRAVFVKVCVTSVGLACLFSLALFAGREWFAALLFGWGKIAPNQLNQVGELAAWGGLSLPAQALMSVCLSHAAVTGRLRQFAFAAVCGALVLAAGLVLYLLTAQAQPARLMLIL